MEKKNTENKKEGLPECVGFILDGNRRWARNQGLATLKGHAKGLKVFEDTITAVHKKGIPHMVAYLFSTENWNRSQDEINYLMDLFRQTLTSILERIQEGNKKIHIRIVGQIERLPLDLQEEIGRVEKNQKIETPELTVWAGISYGGRAEIIDAVNRAVEAGETVSEESFKKIMWTSGMPDPDLIIRTGGEQRLSNFLLWQAAYSEFFFIKNTWPDFGETELESILEEYAGRQRRKGK